LAACARMRCDRRSGLNSDNAVLSPCLRQVMLMSFVPTGKMDNVKFTRDSASRRSLPNAGTVSRSGEALHAEAEIGRIGSCSTVPQSH